MAIREGTIVTTGVKEFIAAVDKAAIETKTLVRGELEKAAVPVRDEAQRLFERYSAKSAAGFGVKAKAVGRVDVYQRLTKTTGQRPDWGAMQMKRALLPALERKSGEVEKRLSDAMDAITAQMGGI